MGVFQISPYDKGGKLFRPSKDCALTVGKELTPMEFALVYGLKNGFHTSSVGISRPSDLDEVMSASRTFSLGQKGGVDVDTLLNKTDTMLKNRFEERVGKEWAEKGLLNLPTCYEKETDGIAVGHILWLHNLLTAFGMYEFCKDRYDSLESTKWDKKKSFEENAGKM
jgi:predicted aldo/keto reductase-like oxidoreductase